MQEEHRSPKVRKPGRPKIIEKSEVGSLQSEEENNSAIDIPHSALETSQIEQPTSEIKTMEVHHHPEVEKKGFKEYILEGLMIFLAVTMGFLAESYREHINERGKEREYMINIKKDLTADTANLNIWIPALYTRMMGFDTLINYLEKPGRAKDGANMYYLARYVTRSTIFEPSDNTILEMKSSGNLRLIRSREIVNDLMNFERVTAQYKNLDDIAQREDILSYPLIGQLFDATIFNKMVIFKKYLGGSEKDYATGQRNVTIRPPGNPQLRSANSDQVNLLIYYLHQRKSTFMGEIHDLDEQRKLATSIIKKIKKEFSLDNE
jgi:hypothetical protein